jgi:hypothetical protein
MVDWQTIAYGDVAWIGGTVENVIIGNCLKVVQVEDRDF